MQVPCDLATHMIRKVFFIEWRAFVCVTYPPCKRFSLLLLLMSATLPHLTHSLTPSLTLTFSLALSLSLNSSPSYQICSSRIIIVGIT
jgi:hypothetical protein